MRRQHHARCRVVAGDVGGEQVQQSVRRVVVCLNSGPEPEEKGSAAERALAATARRSEPEREP